MKITAPLRTKPGAVLEHAVWLDGRETPAERATWEEACRIAMKRAEDEANVVVGPLTFTEKRPGEDRVPPVPGHIAGPDVRLLIAEATVIGYRRVIVETSFLTDLEPKDLKRLRDITKRAYAQSYPNQWLTDIQADAVIEQIGPEAALQTLRDGTHLGVTN